MKPRSKIFLRAKIKGIFAYAASMATVGFLVYSILFGTHIWQSGTLFKGDIVSGLPNPKVAWAENGGWIEYTGTLTVPANGAIQHVPVGDCTLESTALSYTTSGSSIRQIYGSSWCDSIGYIQLSSNETMGVSTLPGNQTEANYGLYIDNTGFFNGYAWSENGQWVSFYSGLPQDASQLQASLLGSVGSLLPYYINIPFPTSVPNTTPSTQTGAVTIINPALSLSFSPLNANGGDPVTLSWSSTGTTACTGHGLPSSDTEGNRSFYAAANLIVTITCQTIDGKTISKSASLSVTNVVTGIATSIASQNGMPEIRTGNTFHGAILLTKNPQMGDVITISGKTYTAGLSTTTDQFMIGNTVETTLQSLKKSIDLSINEVEYTTHPIVSNLKILPLSLKAESGFTYLSFAATGDAFQVLPNDRKPLTGIVLYGSGTSLPLDWNVFANVTLQQTHGEANIAIFSEDGDSTISLSDSQNHKTSLTVKARQDQRGRIALELNNEMFNQSFETGQSFSVETIAMLSNGAVIPLNGLTGAQVQLSQFTWKTDNETILKPYSFGRFEAIGVGTANIWAESSMSGSVLLHSTPISITVTESKPKVLFYRLAPSVLSMGATANISATIENLDGIDTVTAQLELPKLLATKENHLGIIPLTSTVNTQAVLTGSSSTTAVSTKITKADFTGNITIPSVNIVNGLISGVQLVVSTPRGGTIRVPVQITIGTPRTGKIAGGTGPVSILDAITAIRYYTTRAQLTEEQLATIDYNYNGQLDMQDVLEVIRKLGK